MNEENSKYLYDQLVEVIKENANLVSMDHLLEIFSGRVKLANDADYKRVAKQAFKDYIDNKFE